MNRTIKNRPIIAGNTLQQNRLVANLLWGMIICFFIFILSSPGWGQQLVRVNATHFPPFYNVKDNGEVTGLGVDLLKAMNEIQNDYEFILIPVSPRRRHILFDEGRYDLSFFDHLEWGWEDRNVSATDVYLSGGEVFVTANKPNRDQTFFDNIKDKKIAAINGYHYGFAGYESDPTFLNANFNIILSDSQDHILKLVLNDRVDLGIITETYLLQFFRENLTSRSQILISETYDHKYNFRTIVRKDGPISVDKVEQLIYDVRKNPEFDWIKDKYGINW